MFILLISCTCYWYFVLDNNLKLFKVLRLRPPRGTWRGWRTCQQGLPDVVFFGYGTTHPSRG
jgi:hypothetical protein